MPEDPHSRSQPSRGGNQPDDSPTNAPTGRLVTVGEAAEALNISTDAVRGRIKRGTLEAERRDGTVYVRLQDTDQPPTGEDQPQPAAGESNDQSELVEVLREQLDYLRDQLQQERDANRENRRIIAGLAQRIPELTSPAAEASSDEPREAERGSPATGRGDVPEGSRKLGEGGTASRKAWKWLFGPRDV